MDTDNITNFARDPDHPPTLTPAQRARLGAMTDAEVEAEHRSGSIMPWYRVVNAKSDSYVADRDAEDLIRQFSAAFHEAEVSVDAEMFYGRTPSGERVYYFSLSPEAVEIAQGVLASYQATSLAEPPDLTGMQKVRSL